MKTSVMRSVFYIAVCCAFFFSCVPARKYDDLKKKESATRSANDELTAENQALSTKYAHQQIVIDNLTKKLDALQLDSNLRGSTIHTLTTNYDELNQTYQLLLKNYKDLLAGNNTETQKILSQLKNTQDSLLNKEDAFKRLAADLNAKQSNLDKVGKELDASKADLMAKDAKLNELQAILDKKDSTVRALKGKVMDALTGYEGNGLTVTQKNGKIYVSLDESLLFASGSFTVDPKGVEAIKKLAKVLETNQNINVLIEGHTDNVPFKGTGVLKDNWDLSVMRATSIVKIITSNSTVDPKRLTAAGASQFDPVESNDTKAGRASNRRTEIILTPQLDKLFQIIETN